MTQPTLSTGQAELAVSKTTAPRVTEQSIKARIACADYIHRGLLTIAVITLKNGFSVVGVSAPASEFNFDYAVGERYAYDNAFKQLWPLEDCLLREQLSKS